MPTVVCSYNQSMGDVWTNWTAMFQSTAGEFDNESGTGAIFAILLTAA